MRSGRRAGAFRTGLILLVLGVAFATVPADARAQEVAAEAGSLRAVVSEDPWRLELTGPDGELVLAENPGTGPGPAGTLGFRAAGVWRHATSVISSRREGADYVAELETTDPLRTVEVRLSPRGGGVIALEATLIEGAPDLEAMGIGFEATGDERYLGFGERSNAVDQAGNVVENYVADGPYQSEEYPFISPFVPPWGLRERDDSTYFPIPWLLSDAGYGVLIDNPQTSYFRLGTEPGAWSLEVVEAPEGELDATTTAPPSSLRLRFFAGPTPAEALRRFTRATGRQPRPAAPWALGAWYQEVNDDETGEIAAQREADVPVSSLQTYLHYLPCGDQQGVEGEQPSRTAAAHELGVAITTYFNPMVCSNYQPAFGEAEAEAADALTRDQLGSPVIYRYGASPDDSNLVGQYDFFRAAGREEYGKLLGEALDDGYDGWMEDFGEYTPLDSVSGEGRDGSRAHNPYVRRYHCAAFDETRERADGIIRYQRSGWKGTAPCADVVWGGDPTVDWGFDGLASAVRQSLSIGISGIGIWGSDIGGFFALGQNALSGELLKRWVQFGAVSVVMRTQANGVAVPPRDRPQVIDPPQLDNWRRYTKLHTSLYPYLVAAIETYARSGLPPMRHMALSFPGDEEAAAREDQFMLGPDLLAAPVLEPEQRERELRLPAGRWLDLWRSARYLERAGGLKLEAAEILRGGRSVTVPAPLRELPLLVRAGAILPLLPPDVDTLAPYGETSGGAAARSAAGDDLVNLDDRRDQLELLAFPRGSSAARFYRGQSLSSTEGKKRWTLRVNGRRKRSYELQASMTTLRAPFEPCRVSLDGEPLPASAWSYSAADAVLTVSFHTESGRLVATGECATSASDPGGDGERTGGSGDSEPASDVGAGVSGSEDGSSSPGSLPFTGLGLGALILAALGLLAAGAATRARRGG